MVALVLAVPCSVLGEAVMVMRMLCVVLCVLGEAAVVVAVVAGGRRWCPRGVHGDPHCVIITSCTVDATHKKARPGNGATNYYSNIFHSKRKHETVEKTDLVSGFSGARVVYLFARLPRCSSSLIIHDPRPGWGEEWGGALGLKKDYVQY